MTFFGDIGLLRPDAWTVLSFPLTEIEFVLVMVEQGSQHITQFVSFRQRLIFASRPELYK